jgi:hypothetical protein
LNADHLDAGGAGDQRARKQPGHQHQFVFRVKGADHFVSHQVKKNSSGDTMPADPLFIIRRI